MTRDEIEAAAREAGLRVTYWYPQLGGVAEFAPHLNLWHVATSDEYAWFVGDIEIVSILGESYARKFCELPEALAAIRADIDEIAAVRIPDPFCCGSCNCPDCRALDRPPIDDD